MKPFNCSRHLQYCIQSLPYKLGLQNAYVRSFTCLPVDYSLTVYQIIVIITFGDNVRYFEYVFHCLSHNTTVTTGYCSALSLM